MVNMAHYSNNRCSWNRFAGNFNRCFQGLFNFVFLNRLGNMAHFFNQNNSGILIQDLIDSGHCAHTHQRFDYFGRFNRHTLR